MSQNENASAWAVQEAVMNVVELVEQVTHGQQTEVVSTLREEARKTALHLIAAIIVSDGRCEEAEREFFSILVRGIGELGLGLEHPAQYANRWRSMGIQVPQFFRTALQYDAEHKTDSAREMMREIQLAGNNTCVSDGEFAAGEHDVVRNYLVLLDEYLEFWKAQHGPPAEGVCEISARSDKSDFTSATAREVSPDCDSKMTALKVSDALARRFREWTIRLAPRSGEFIADNWHITLIARGLPPKLSIGIQEAFPTGYMAATAKGINLCYPTEQQDFFGNATLDGEPEANQLRLVKLQATVPAPHASVAPVEIEHARAELDAMVGLDGVKQQVSVLIDFLKIEKLRQERGMAKNSISLHAVFSGPPGTGKTSVARLLGRIYGSSLFSVGSR